MTTAAPIWRHDSKKRLLRGNSISGRNQPAEVSSKGDHLVDGAATILAMIIGVLADFRAQSAALRRLEGARRSGDSS